MHECGARGRTAAGEMLEECEDSTYEVPTVRAKPSTLDPEFSLTVSNASSSDYTLGVMSVVALVSVPFILAYQAWSYWVFRKRLTADAIPQVAVVVPAVRDVAADKS